MKIVHISDPHAEGYEKLNISPCDLLICSGDVGSGRTNIGELTRFFIWFEAQPADVKIFVPGNHDVLLDKKFPAQQENKPLEIMAIQAYRDAQELLKAYKIKYLCDKEYVYKGLKFYGSPYSPSFGHNWAFNADRGKKIQRVWSKIPSDVDVLITHGPPYGVLDLQTPRKRVEGVDPHLGCQDLRDVILKRLKNLKLCCFGHIHENYGLVQLAVSNTRRVLFSNGTVLDDRHDQTIINPIVINL